MSGETRDTGNKSQQINGVFCLSDIVRQLPTPGHALLTTK